MVLTDDLRHLLAPVLADLDAKEKEKIEESLLRLEKRLALQEKKLHRAILDRHAVHSLMKRTSGELARKYQTLFEQDTNPRVVIENDGTIVLANSSFCSLIHKSREDVENKKNLCDYITGMPCDPFTEGKEPAGSAEPPASIAGQIHTGSGEFADVLISQTAFPESTQSIVTFVNMGERLRLERKVMETSALLSGILRASPVGFHVTDCEGKYVYMNEAWSSITGFSPGEALGRFYDFILHPHDRRRVVATIHETAQRMGSSDVEARIVRPDGTIRDGVCHFVPVLDDSGHATGWVGAITDISERKKIGQELEESRAYLGTLVASVQVGILVIDVETRRIVDANPAALHMIGAGKEEVVGRVCHRFICPTGQGKCPVVDLGQLVDNSERVLLTARGEAIPIIKHVVPVTLNGRNCLLETFIDNAYRKGMEQALKESEEKFRALAENTGDVLYTMDMDATLTYISPQAAKYGYAPEEVIGRPLHAFVHPQDLELVRSSLGDVARMRDPPTLMFRIFDRQGNIFWLEAKSSLRPDDLGRPAGFLGILRDVTDRKHAEDAIELANRKLNLMNNVTRHDILNTLTGVYGLLDMAHATLSEEERLAFLGEIRGQARLIQRHINFTKQYQEVGIHLPQWQQVAEVAGHAFSNFARSGVTFSADLGLLEVYADPLLEKVFYNLIDNAIRYGGDLTSITVTGEPCGEKEFRILFQDNGVGIPPAEKERIFERGIGKNTGLGLFMCREILAITGITITENGEQGKGARFVIAVPPGMHRQPVA